MRSPMSLMMVFILACGVYLVWPALAAHGGVYLFRDQSGRVVLSDVPAVANATRVIGDPKTEESIGGFVTEHERVALYVGLIRKFSRIYNLPEHLVKAVIQAESAFNPNAISHKGALGLMQVMPSTAKDIGIFGNLKEPEINIEAGCRYLSMMMSRFKGQLQLALAAYNAGPETVEQAGNAIPNIPETKAYVNNVMDIMNRYKTGSVYIVELSPGRFLLTNY